MWALALALALARAMHGSWYSTQLRADDWSWSLEERGSGQWDIEPMPDVQRDAPEHLDASMIEAASTDIVQPDEGYRPCAERGDSCRCPRGEVRFGRADKDMWSAPILVGPHDSVDCSLETLREKRVIYPEVSGADAALECQCIERRMRLKTPELGANEVSTMLQLDAAGAAVASNATQMRCLRVPITAASFVDSRQSAKQESLLEHYLALEAATKVETSFCDDEADFHWTYLLSSQQLRHDKTGKCLTAFVSGSSASVSARDCTVSESKEYIQRWSADCYQMPGFIAAACQLQLATSSGAGALCLSTASAGGAPVYIRPCSEGATAWTLESVSRPHAWSRCSAETDKCMCAGEIRIGDAEESLWSHGVPAPNTLDMAEAVSCNVVDLRSLALPDPVTMRFADDPDGRQCECRFDEEADPDAGTTEAEEEQKPLSSTAEAQVEVEAFGDAVGLNIQQMRDEGDSSAKVMLAEIFLYTGGFFLFCCCGCCAGKLPGYLKELHHDEEGEEGEEGEEEYEEGEEGEAEEGG